MDNRLGDIMDMGVRWMFDNLQTASPFSLRMLRERTMSMNAGDIEENYELLNAFCMLTSAQGQWFDTRSRMKSYLSHLRDIRQTISSLGGSYMPDDIELFEIKSLAIVGENMRPFVNALKLKNLMLPDLSGVLTLLDPENTGIHSFYIYDAYDERLPELRKRIRQAGEYTEELQYQAAIIEDAVRKSLTLGLLPFRMQLQQALQVLARVDILMAQAMQVHQLKLVIPEVHEDTTSIRGMFNPEVKELLEREGKCFEAVDISFSLNQPLLITGANMGGKSLSLRTLAMVQLLFQFGFGIPAESASLVPVEKVFFSGGDQQDMLKGMSSFAAEMKHINAALTCIEQGDKMLCLIDEPARTTNPAEGAALVKALLQMLINKPSLCVLTTHYNIRNVECKRLRVKGFNEGKMYYQLVEDLQDETPKEALRIAQSLGINSRWLQLAANQLENINIKSV